MVKRKNKVETKVLIGNDRIDLTPNIPKLEPETNTNQLCLSSLLPSYRDQTPTTTHEEYQNPARTQIGAKEGIQRSSIAGPLTLKICSTPSSTSTRDQVGSENLHLHRCILFKPQP